MHENLIPPTSWSFARAFLAAYILRKRFLDVQMEVVDHVVFLKNDFVNCRKNEVIVT